MGNQQSSARRKLLIIGKAPVSISIHGKKSTKPKRASKALRRRTSQVASPKKAPQSSAKKATAPSPVES